LRGYYCFKDFLPDEDIVVFPFFDIEDSPFVLIEYDEVKGKFVLFFDFDNFVEIKALQVMERFIFGRVLTYAFAVSDGRDRPYACQR